MANNAVSYLLMGMAKAVPSPALPTAKIARAGSGWIAKAASPPSPLTWAISNASSAPTSSDMKTHMVFRSYFTVVLLILSFPSCNKTVEKSLASSTIKLGKSATIDDLSEFRARWHEAKSAVVLYDSRICVKENLTLKTLTYFNIESLGSLLVSSSGYKHNIDLNKVKKIFVVSFFDPCGDSANISWVFVDVGESFEVIDHEQIME